MLVMVTPTVSGSAQAAPSFAAASAGEHAKSCCLLVSWMTPHSRAGRRLRRVAGRSHGFERCRPGSAGTAREGDVLGRSQFRPCDQRALLSADSITVTGVLEPARDCSGEQPYGDQAAIPDWH